MTAASTTPVFLDAVDQRLASVLTVGEVDRGTEVLIEAARNLVLAGGKRARPWLVYTLGTTLGAPVEPLVDVAVTAELIHAASLLHDDVIDEGRERRGRPTANVLWGNLSAVLSGDLLLTIALQQLRAHPARLMHEAIDVIAIMTRASLLEAACRGRLDVSPEAWRTIAVGKTAELFGWCGLAAGLCAGDEGAAQRLRAACRHLGVAFQLANDLDDVYGRTPGKDALADVQTGNASYPVLLALSDPAARPVIESAWGAIVSAEQSVAVQRAVTQSGAASATWDGIGAEVHAAREALGPYLAHPAATPVIAWADRLWQTARPPQFG